MITFLLIGVSEDFLGYWTQVSLELPTILSINFKTGTNFQAQKFMNEKLGLPLREKPSTLTKIVYVFTSLLQRPVVI